MSDLVPGSAEIIERNVARILEYISPSQVEAFELCPRRWYNASVLGHREAETLAMRRGTVIGKHAEDFYESNGQKRPSGEFAELAAVVLPVLGEPGPGVTVEQWVELPTAPGFPKVRGRYDYFDRIARPRIEGHPPMPALKDIKSRSKKIYFKTTDPSAPDDKRIDMDAQLNVYGRAKLVELGVPAIAVGHTYTLTSGKPKASEVLFVATMESTEPRWLKTVESVKKLTMWARGKHRDADPLPPNTAACDKYPPNGCPHRARCGFSTPPQGLAGALRAASGQGETTMATTDGLTLMQRLEAEKARLLGQAPPATNGTPPAAPKTPEPAPAAPAKSLEERLGKPAAAPAKESEPAPAAPKEEDPIQKARRQIAEGTLKMDPGTGQVATKEGADSGWIMRPPTFAEGIAFDEAKKGAPAPAAAAPAASSLLPEDAPSRTSTPEEVAAATEPKKKGGKKAKAAPAAAADEESPGRDPALDRAAFDKEEAAPAAPAPAPAATQHPVPQSDALPGAGPVIYVDCFPVKGAHKTQIVHFEEWMAPICEEVARKKGVMDWRLIQYTAKGDLAAEVRGVISTLPPVIHVSKFAPSADVFLECVTPWAAAIIRGI